MGMTIDDHIEVLKSYSHGFTGYAGNLQDSIDVAMDTMRKYQQLQADYETRLKADMVAIFTELQVGIGEHINPSNHTDSYEDGWSEGAEWCIDYIQQKINSLKEA